MLVAIIIEFLLPILSAIQPVIWQPIKRPRKNEEAKTYNYIGVRFHSFSKIGFNNVQRIISAPSIKLINKRIKIYFIWNWPNPIRFDKISSNVRF